jgi:hypothetical protein
MALLPHHWWFESGYLLCLPPLATALFDGTMGLLLCMQGPIPGQWANSTYWQESLVDLRLANSGLTSALPAPWNLHNLTHLDLSNTSLTGYAPALFTSKLEYLDISNNAGLTGYWTEILWGDVTSLTVLRMSNIGFGESEVYGGEVAVARS